MSEENVLNKPNIKRNDRSFMCHTKKCGFTMNLVAPFPHLKKENAYFKHKLDEYKKNQILKNISDKTH